jgi:hypothetical protein
LKRDPNGQDRSVRISIDELAKVRAKDVTAIRSVAADGFEVYGIVSMGMASKQGILTYSSTVKSRMR